MKIIYYSPHPTHDIVSEVGYSTHQREIINALRDLGHEVKPVIMGGTEIGNLSKAGIPVKEKGLRASFKKWIPVWLWVSLKDFKLLIHDRKAAALLNSEIIRFRPDLIYERSEYLQDGSVKVVRSNKVTHFLEVNAPFVEEMREFEGPSLFHRLAHRKEKNKLLGADKIVVVSSSLSRFLINRYGVNDGKIIVQPNCISEGAYTGSDYKVQQIKLTLGIQNKRVIGFVGSIFPHHGLEVLISAFHELHVLFPDTVLMIVGDGSILPALKNMVSKLKDSEHVKFCGKQSPSDVFAYIECMDICVMAQSNWYGSPMKLFEYALLGKPVIAPETEPVKDVMTDGVHGILVKPETIALLDALKRMLSDMEEARRMGERFKRIVTENYTWKKAASKIIASCESPS